MVKLQHELRRMLNQSDASTTSNYLLKIAAAHAKKIPILLYGAGQRGTDFCQLLNEMGVKADCFVDAASEKHGTYVNAVLVRSSDCILQFKDNNPLVIVTPILYHESEAHRREIDHTLTQAGCKTWIVLPRDRFYAWTIYYLRHISAIEAFADMLADDRSVQTLSRYLGAYMLEQPFEAKRPGETQYFADDLFSLSDHENVVDCGAYSGDTLQDYFRFYRGFSRYAAFEPEVGNQRLLEHTVQSLSLGLRDLVTVYPYAVSDANQTQRFNLCEGNPSGSGISEEGALEVPCVRLDDILVGQAPTYIKMDIEGAELSALEGATHLIEKYRPILAVCVYHRPSDFVDIPHWMQHHCPQYKFFLRKYYTAPVYTELVLYAVPVERCLKWSMPDEIENRS